MAAHTGTGCIDHAGHVSGQGFAVQANMMASPSVWPAMAEAYVAATGPMPRRLLDAQTSLDAELRATLPASGGWAEGSSVGWPRRSRPR